MTGELHPSAKEELSEGASWYAERSALAAARFLTAVESAMTSILADPLRYQPAAEKIRVFRLKSFPYKIYFHFDAEAQHIKFLCVMHNKRRSEYWRSRK